MVEDGVDNPDERVTISHRVSGGGDYDQLAAPALALSILDNDERGIRTLPTAGGTLQEGGAAFNLDILLDSTPTGPVTVAALVGASDFDVRVSEPLVLGDGSLQGRLTVQVADDEMDRPDEMVTIRFRVTGGDYTGQQIQPFVFSIRDDDERGLTLTPTELTVGEGATGDYEVVLNSQPIAGEVMVAVASAAENFAVEVARVVLGGSPTFSASAVLTFDQGNWNVSQTVRISVVEDAEDDPDERVTITHRVSGGGDYHQLAAPALALSILDNDGRDIWTSPKEGGILEEGGAAFNLDISLNSPPTGPVTVAALAAASDFDVRVSEPVVLGDGSLQGRLTIRVADDEVDRPDEMVTISFRVTGADYAGQQIPPFTFSIRDDDERGLTLMPTELTVAEGATGDYEVVLNSQPTTSETEVRVAVMPAAENFAVEVAKVVSIVGGGSLDFSASALLTFAPENWNVSQTVRINVVEDGVDNPDERVTITHRVSGGGDYDLLAAPALALSILDNDERGIRTSPMAGGILEEGGAAFNLEISLNSTPTGPVTVAALAAASDFDLRVSEPIVLEGGSLQGRLTVRVADDEVDRPDEMVTISFTVTGADYAGQQIPPFTFLIRDDDERGLTLTPTGLTVAEGATGDYEVVLNSQPTTGETEVRVAVMLAAENFAVEVARVVSIVGGGSLDFSASALLTFAPENWNVSQTVRINVVEDGVDNPDERVTITHRVSGGGDYDLLAAPALALSILDNDERGIRTSPMAGGILEEGGAAFNLEISLNSTPTGPVTVAALAAASDFDLRVSEPIVLEGGSLQGRLTIQVADDEVDRPDEMVMISFRVSGGDYAGEQIQPFAFSIRDNDERGIQTLPTAGGILEEGGAAFTMDISLNSTPTGPVTVAAMAAASDFDLRVSEPLVLEDGSLQGWLTVRVADDEVDRPNAMVMISFTVTGGDYGGQQISPFTFSIEDNDERGLTLMPTALTVEEGDEVTYTVVLKSRPGDTVEVTFELSAPDSGITLEPESLSFAPGVWSIPQQVRVLSAENDVDTADTSLRITPLVSSGDPAYNQLVAAELPVMVLLLHDDDERGVTISPVALELLEGESGVYTVVLASEPTAPVTVRINAAAGLSVALSAPVHVQANTGSSGLGLYFNERNWDRTQTVTMTATRDFIDEELETKELQITHEVVSAGDYSGAAAAAVAVTVTDVDMFGLNVRPRSLTLCEGEDSGDCQQSGSFEVSLSSRPAAAVSVFIALAADSAASELEWGVVENGALNPELTFTRDDWADSRTVVVRAVDNDIANIAARNYVLSLGVSSPGDSRYQGCCASQVAVQVKDQLDRTGLVFAAPGGGDREGSVLENAGHYGYTVALRSQPTGEVTVEVTIPEGDTVGDPSYPDGALTFNAVNWEEPKLVLVPLTDNDDVEGELTLVIAHAASGADYAEVAGEFELTIEDNDSPPTRVTLSADVSPLEFAEDAGSVVVRLTARLNNVPFATDMGLVLSVGSDSSAEGTDFTATLDSLEFAPGTEVTRPIAVGTLEISIELVLTPTEDDLDEGVSETLVIIASVTDLQGSEVELRILDDDTSGIALRSPDGRQPVSSLRVPEGEEVVYSLVLTSQPFADVVLSLSVVGDGADDITIPEQLTFTASDWDQPQQVTVAAAVNEESSEVRELSIVHAVTSGDERYLALPPRSFPLKLTDPGLVVLPASLSLEEGEEAVYTLALTSEPEQPVTVSLRVSGDGEALRLEDGGGQLLESLSFDASNWSEPQEVQVLAVKDGYSTGRRTATIAHVIDTEDADYLGVVLPSVEVTIEDIDPLPGIRLELSPSRLPEGGPGDLPLDGRHRLVVRAVVDGPLRSAATTLSLSIGGNGDTATSQDYSTNLADNNILMIPALTRAVQLEIILMLFQDRIDELDEFFTVAITADLDPEAPRTSTAALPFTIEDDDQAGVEVGLQPQNLREGDVLTWEVVLTSQPTAEVLVTVSAVSPADSPVESRARVEDLVIAPASLTFTNANWNTPQPVMITVAPDLTRFGELTIVHEVTSTDPNYQVLVVPLVTLELTDVDASLQILELRLEPGGDPISLVGAPDAPAVEGFDPNVPEYRAEVPFGAGQVFLTATPAVTQDLVVDGTLVQNRAEVRLFRRVEGALVSLENSEDIAASPDLPVGLPSDEDEFVLLAEVSVPPLATEMDGETTWQTWTLTLRRALPAAAELVIFRASDEGRETPLTAATPLLFAADDNSMELIFVVRDGDGTSYAIDAVVPPDGSVVAGGRLVVDVGEQTETNGDFATPVTLRRDAALMAGTLTFALTFTATPERPLAVGAEELRADITGTLFDNADTETQFRATWRGHDQEMDLPLAPGDPLRVSANGPLTITLKVERSGGGVRSFEQSSFTFSVVSPVNDPQVNLDGNILEIGAGADLPVEVAATGVDTLGDGVNDPTALSFSVAFEQPTALIRAVAPDSFNPSSPDPLFAFVGEDKRLPLEVVLADDSTPLAEADRNRIFRALSLAVTSMPVDLTPTVVALVEPADPEASLSDLLFNVAAAQNDVSFEVAVPVAEQSELVTVAPLNLGAHFLSLEHEQEVRFLNVSGEDFVADANMVEIALRGEAAGVEDEIWTLAVANAVELKDDGYQVEEVLKSLETWVFGLITKEGTTTPTYSLQTYTLVAGVDPNPRFTVTISVDGVETEVTGPGAVSVTVTVGPDTTLITVMTNVNGVEAEVTVSEPVPVADNDLPDGALAMFEEDSNLKILSQRLEIMKAVYQSGSPDDAVTRTLRIRRLRPDAENSRVVLRFGYSPPAGMGEAGEFIRIIELETGVIEVLRVEVSPARLVVARGGSAGSVTLVVGNLPLAEDPARIIGLFEREASNIIKLFYDTSDLEIIPRAGRVDVINRRFEQVLPVRALPSGDRPDYEVRVEVGIPGIALGRTLGRAGFSVDINDPPRYEGERLLSVLESGEVRTWVLRVLDPDGGTEFLNPSALTLTVIGFGVDLDMKDHSFLLSKGLHENDYFSLSASEVILEKADDEAPASGNANSLVMTLTLTGKLATPYGSVVELRLDGVSDGYDDLLPQRLVVGVENAPLTFELETTTIAVFPDQAAVSLPVEMFSDGSAGERTTGLRIVVLEAPDDLVVKFDSAEGALGAITLRRLNASRSGDTEVKLVVLNAQGGRTEVTIKVQRPSLLPEIVPPQPLFIAAGDMQTWQVRLAGGDTELDVTWTWTAEPETAGDMLEVAVRTLPGGHAEVAVTASVNATGEVFTLNLTATDNGLQQRQALLPVVVVAPGPRPRLQLSLSAADPDNPADPTARVTVSSLLLTETLYIGATLVGATPEVLESLGLLTATIRITKIGEDGAATGTAFELTVTSTFSVEPFSLEASVAAIRLTERGSVELADGDVAEVSIEADAASGIAGDRLRLRVIEPIGLELSAILSTVMDRDNDGLVDRFDAEAAPASALGPLTVALVRVTDSGVEVQQQEVRLSLGDWARALGLGQCGGVSLKLKLSDGESEPMLEVCGEEEPSDGSLVAVVSANEQFGREETGEEEVQLIDLSATFDSSDAGPDEPLVINLPFDPESYRVYRYDEASDRWVLVIGVILSGPGSGSPGSSGGTAGLENVRDCQTCLYAADPDRDGSVELLLLVQTVEPELSFAVTSNEVVLDSVLEVADNATLTLVLTGLEEEDVLSVRVVQVDKDGNVVEEDANVEGFFVQRATIDGGPTVELRGLKRTGNGPEEVQVGVTNSEGETVTATFYVTVANQPPEIKFMLDGEETTSIKLQPGVEVMLEVVFEDPDGDSEFRLELTPEDGGGVAQLVPRLVRGVGSAGDQIENRLFLTSDTPRAPFTLSLKAIDVSDDSPTTAPLTVCFFNEDGECPAATGGGSGGGGGGGTGLLWLFLLAPAVLVRLRQRPHASTSLLA